MPERGTDVPPGQGQEGGCPACSPPARSRLRARSDGVLGVSGRGQGTAPSPALPACCGAGWHVGCADRVLPGPWLAPCRGWMCAQCVQGCVGAVWPQGTCAAKKKKNLLLGREVTPPPLLPVAPWCMFPSRSHQPASASSMWSFLSLSYPNTSHRPCLKWEGEIWDFKCHTSSCFEVS